MIGSNQMSTKAKCLALAKKHDIELQLWGDGYDVCIPDGFTLSDYDDRTGLSASGAETKKELWKYCYMDIKECVAKKPWFKIPEEWK